MIITIIIILFIIIVIIIEISLILSNTHNVHPYIYIYTDKGNKYSRKRPKSRRQQQQHNHNQRKHRSKSNSKTTSQPHRRSLRLAAKAKTQKLPECSLSPNSLKTINVEQAKYKKKIEEFNVSQHIKTHIFFVFFFFCFVPKYMFSVIHRHHYDNKAIFQMIKAVYF